jgi:hypothetical protein
MGRLGFGRHLNFDCDLTSALAGDTGSGSMSRENFRFLAVSSGIDGSFSLGSRLLGSPETEPKPERDPEFAL